VTLGVLAAAASSSTSEDVGTGVIAFLIVAAIGVALVFLLLSMNKQFRKIDANPLEPGPPEGDGADQKAKDPAQTELSRRQAVDQVRGVVIYEPVGPKAGRIMQGEVDGVHLLGRAGQPHYDHPDLKGLWVPQDGLPLVTPGLVGTVIDRAVDDIEADPLILHDV
jgi:hypothetical protein